MTGTSARLALAVLALPVLWFAFGVVSRWMQDIVAGEEDCAPGHLATADLAALMPDLPAGFELVRSVESPCSDSEIATSHANLHADYVASADPRSAARSFVTEARRAGWTLTFPRDGQFEERSGEVGFALEREAAGTRVVLSGSARDIAAARAAGVRGPGFDAARGRGKPRWISVAAWPEPESLIPEFEVGDLVPATVPGISR